VITQWKWSIATCPCLFHNSSTWVHTRTKSSWTSSQVALSPTTYKISYWVKKQQRQQRNKLQIVHTQCKITLHLIQPATKLKLQINQDQLLINHLSKLGLTLSMDS